MSPRVSLAGTADVGLAFSRTVGGIDMTPSLGRALTVTRDKAGG